MALTEAEIHNIADELLKETGALPTLVAVRSKLGGGSYTTISEAMKKWRSAHLGKAIQAESIAVPSEFSGKADAFLCEMWAFASRLADEKLDAEREAFKTVQGETDARVAELEELIIALETEKKAQLEVTKTLEENLEAITEEHSKTTEKLKTAETQITRLTARVAEFEQLKSTHNEVLSEFAETKIELAKITEQVDNKDKDIARLSSHIESLEKQRDDEKARLIDVSAAKTELENQVNQNNVDIAKLTAQADLADSLTVENRGLVKQVAKIEAKLNLLDSQLSDKQTRLEALQKQLADKDKNIAVP